METEEQPNLIQRLIDKISGREVLALGGEVGAGVGLDIATQKLLYGGPKGVAAYGAINLVGGSLANYHAQQARTEEDLEWHDRDWGEVLSAGIIGIVPGMGGKFAKGPLHRGYLNLGRRGNKLATATFGKSNTYQRAITFGAATGAADQVFRQGFNERRLPTKEELLYSAAGGAVLGPAAKRTFDTLVPAAAKIYKKFKGKTPEEIAATITGQEKRHLTYLQKAILEARESGNSEALNRYLWQYRKAQGDVTTEPYVDYEDYLESTQGSLMNIADDIDDPSFDMRYYSNKHLSPEEYDEYSKFMDDYEFKDEPIAARLESIQVAQDLGLDPNVDTAEMRKITGHIPLKQLEDIARRNKQPRTAVWKYLSIQKENQKELKRLLKWINNVEGVLSADKIDDFIEAEQTSLGKKTIKYLQRQRNYYRNKTSWDKGHKEGLLRRFLEYKTGGDVSSNLFVERASGVTAITLPNGKKIAIPSNRVRSGVQEEDLYTLVKLQNASWNLEDDFRKTIMPHKFRGEGIDPSYTDTASTFYRMVMEEAMNILGISKRNMHLPPNKAALIGFSRALTDALHAYFRRAREMGIPFTELESREIANVSPKELNKKFKELDKIFHTVLARKIEKIKPGLRLDRKDWKGIFPSKTYELTQPDKPGSIPKSG